jgi:sulfur-oxidizing protein SoxY
MDPIRRAALKTSGSAALYTVLAALGLIKPGVSAALQRDDAAFSMKSLGDAIKALGAQSPVASDAVLITAPTVAENGAVVPLLVESKVPGTQSIMLLIEKNPTPLAATFTFPPGTETAISTRVKMGQSSDVYALVKAQGRFYMKKQEIKITLGGCG